MIRFTNAKWFLASTEHARNMAPPARHTGRNGRHASTELARRTEEGLGKRWSAGLSRVGRRFARRTDALEDRDRRPRLRLVDENRSDGRQEENGESRGAGRFRRSGEIQRVVGRGMRSVMVTVVMVVAIIVIIVMQSGGDRSQRVVKMRLGREMDGDETNVEREQQRGEQTAPPTHLVRRAMAALRLASASHQWRESSFPVRRPSIIKFRRAGHLLTSVSFQSSRRESAAGRA